MALFLHRGHFMRIWQSSTKPNVLGNWYFYSIGETAVSIWSQPRPQSKFNLFFCFSLIAKRCTGDEVDLFCSFRKTGKTNKLTKKVTENHFTISLSNAKQSYQSTPCHFCNWFGKWFGTWFETFIVASVSNLLKSCTNLLKLSHSLIWSHFLFPI